MAPGDEPQPCAHCGYFSVGTPCPLCGDEVLNEPAGRPIRPGRRFFVADFAAGFTGLFRAAIHLLTRKEYFGRLWAPIAASLLAGGIVLALAIWVVHPAVVWLTEQDWTVTRIIASAAPWRAAALPIVLTVVIVASFGPVLIQTLTLPFVDPLADALEKMLGGSRLQSVQRSRWQGFGANVRASAQILAMQMLVLLPCLLLSFCKLGAVLALGVAAFLTALLWFEIPFARRGYSIDQRIRIVRHNWARALGFGVAFELAMFVPMLNLVLLGPAAAVAVTASYFHFAKLPATGIVRPPPAAIP